VISLLVSIRKCKEKRGGEDPEPSGVISLLLLRRKCKQRGGGRSGAFGSDFLIVSHKDAKCFVKNRWIPVRFLTRKM
jgi:hypothetical protein